MKKLSLSTFLLLLLSTFALTGCASLLAQGESVVQPVSTVGEPAITIQPSNGQETTPNDEQQEEVPQVVPEATEESVEQAAPQIIEETAPPAQIAPDSVFAQEQTFVSIYEQANQAVVHIGTGGGQGSGFVIDTQGHIVTNNHVVEGAGFIEVTFADGRTEDARLIGRDPDSDLAVIKVDVPANELVTLSLADSDALKVGQIVIAIGNPFGLSGTMTTGIISSLDRELDGGVAPGGGSYRIPDVIQTDAAINPGNSGGPLLNLQGQVIGVNSAIRSASNSNAGIGFAVPANIVNAVAPQLIANGTVSHPWLGIAGGTLTEDAAQQLGLSQETRGVIISSVVANGPASNAGIIGGNPATGLGGDIIIGINDRIVETFDDLLGYIVQQTVVGQTVEVTVLRNGSPVSLSMTLGARPAGQ